MKANWKDYAFVMLMFGLFIANFFLFGEKYIRTNEPTPLAAIVCIATIVSLGIATRIAHWIVFRNSAFVLIGLSIIIQLYLYFTSFYDFELEDLIETRKLISLTMLIGTAYCGAYIIKKIVEKKRFECEELNILDK